LVEKTINYKHIKLEKNRAFIDIATYGCGFGCEYCYTEGKKDRQVLLTQEQLLFSLNITRTSSYFEKGRNGSVITLCPNTEPLMTNSVSALGLNIISPFLSCMAMTIRFRSCHSHRQYNGRRVYSSDFSIFASREWIRSILPL